MTEGGREASGSPEPCWVDFDGPVHYIDHGGPESGPVLVCVHGLGGSLVNWAALAPLLTPSARVLALDLAGFGRTRSGTRSTSVTANQRLLHRFVTEVVGAPVVLVGNSMGGLISILQASEHPETVAGLVLIDPALPVGLSARPDPRVALAFAAFALPAVGRTLLARRRESSSARAAATDLLRLCCVDPSRVPEHVVDQHVELAQERREYPDVDAELVGAAQSLLRVLVDGRGYAARQRAVDVPVLLLHGDKDRLVPIASARAAARANPTWQFHVAADVGHVPQLEAPGWTAHRILDWLDQHPECATAARHPAPGGTP